MKTKTQKPARKLTISSARQLKALGSPVRQMVVEALVLSQQPASIKQIAHRINRTPESLYYHFRALEKAGLILDAGSKQEHGKPVGLYLPAAREISIKYDFSIPGFRKNLRAIFGATIRLAWRDFDKGIELDHARCETETRNLYMGRGEAWLPKDQIRKINQHIDEIRKIMNANPDPSGGERCSVFVAMSPLEVRD